MIASFPKPSGFASVTSPRPSPNSISLGRVLGSLADRFSVEDPAGEAGAALRDFLAAHERYADSSRIAKLSSAHAVKSWAAERLPALGISYGFANRIAPDAIQANLDERAPLKVVEFADELTLIAGFCRAVDEVKIEATQHSQGLAFHFTLKGRLLSEGREDIESDSLRQLLQSYARENCLRNRIVAGPDQIEAEAIVLRKKVRLGFSPLF